MKTKEKTYIAPKKHRNSINNNHKNHPKKMECIYGQREEKKDGLHLREKKD